MARLFGLSQEQVARIRPFFPKERDVSGWMPLPTKPSAIVAAPGETRVSLI